MQTSDQERYYFLECLVPVGLAFLIEKYSNYNLTMITHKAIINNNTQYLTQFYKQKQTFQYLSLKLQIVICLSISCQLYRQTNFTSNRHNKKMHLIFCKQFSYPYAFDNSLWC